MSTLMLFNQVDQVNDFITELLEEYAGELGLEFVGKNDERLLSRYPAVVCSSVGKTKEVHGTHTYNVEMRFLIWVYHANMTQTHRQRSDEDIRLAEAVEDVLELDKTMGGQVIWAMVESSIPGILRPRATSSGRGEPIVGTRMQLYVLSQERF